MVFLTTTTTAQVGREATNPKLAQQYQKKSSGHKVMNGEVYLLKSYEEFGKVEKECLLDLSLLFEHFDDDEDEPMLSPHPAFHSIRLPLSTSSPLVGLKKRVGTQLNHFLPNSNISTLCASSRLFAKQAETRSWEEVRSDQELAKMVNDWHSIQDDDYHERIDQISDKLFSVLQFPDHSSFTKAVHSTWQLCQNHKNLPLMFPADLGLPRVKTLVGLLKDGRPLYDNITTTVQLAVSGILLAVTKGADSGLLVESGAMSTCVQILLNSTDEKNAASLEGEEHLREEQVVDPKLDLISVLLIHTLSSCTNLQRGLFAAAHAKHLLTLAVKTEDFLRLRVLLCIRLTLDPEAIAALIDSSRSFLDPRRWSHLYCTLLNMVVEDPTLDLSTRIIVFDLIASVCKSPVDEQVVRCLLGYDPDGAIEGREDSSMSIIPLSLLHHLVSQALWCTKSFEKVSTRRTSIVNKVGSRDGKSPAFSKELKLPFVHVQGLRLVHYNHCPGLSLTSENPEVIIETLLDQILASISRVVRLHVECFPFASQSPGSKIPSFVHRYLWRSLMYVLINTPASTREAAMQTLAYCCLMEDFTVMLPKDCYDCLRQIVGRDNVSRVGKDENKVGIQMSVGFVLLGFSTVRDSCIVLAKAMRGLEVFVKLVLHLTTTGSFEVRKLVSLAALRFCSHCCETEMDVVNSRACEIDAYTKHHELKHWRRALDSITPDETLDQYGAVSAEDWCGNLGSVGEAKSSAMHPKKPTFLEKKRYTEKDITRMENEEASVLTISQRQIEELCLVVSTLCNSRRDEKTRNADASSATNLVQSLCCVLASETHEVVNTVEGFAYLLDALEIVAKMNLSIILAVVEAIHLSILGHRELVIVLQEHENGRAIRSLVDLLKIGFALSESESILIHHTLNLLWHISGHKRSTICLDAEILRLLYCSLGRSSQISREHRRIAGHILHQICKLHPGKVVFKAIESALGSEVEDVNDVDCEELSLEFVVDCLESEDLTLKGIGALLYRSLPFSPTSQERLECLGGGRRLLEILFTNNCAKDDQLSEIKSNAMFGLFALVKEQNPDVQVTFAKYGLYPLLVLSSSLREEQLTMQEVNEVKEESSVDAVEDKSHGDEENGSELIVNSSTVVDSEQGNALEHNIRHSKLLAQILNVLSRNLRIRSLFYHAELRLRDRARTDYVGEYTLPWKQTHQPGPSSSGRCHPGPAPAATSKKLSIAETKVEKQDFVTWLSAAFEERARPSSTNAEEVVPSEGDAASVVTHVPQIGLHRKLCQPVSTLWNRYKVPTAPETGHKRWTPRVRRIKVSENGTPEEAEGKGVLLIKDGNVIEDNFGEDEEEERLQLIEAEKRRQALLMELGVRQQKPVFNPLNIELTIDKRYVFARDFNRARPVTRKKRMHKDGVCQKEKGTVHTFRHIKGSTIYKDVCQLKGYQVAVSEDGGDEEVFIYTSVGELEIDPEPKSAPPVSSSFYVATDFTTFLKKDVNILIGNTRTYKDALLVIVDPDAPSKSVKVNNSGSSKRQKNRQRRRSSLGDLRPKVVSVESLLPKSTHHPLWSAEGLLTSTMIPFALLSPEILQILNAQAKANMIRSFPGGQQSHQPFKFATLKKRKKKKRNTAIL